MRLKSQHHHSLPDLSVPPLLRQQARATLSASADGVSRACGPSSPSGTTLTQPHPRKLRWQGPCAAPQALPRSQPPPRRSAAPQCPGPTLPIHHRRRAQQSCLHLVANHSPIYLDRQRLTTGCLRGTDSAGISLTVAVVLRPLH
jgi:hypothetical protein